jgi:hypothetical protein
MGAHDFGDHTVFTKADDILNPPEKPVEWGYNCLTQGIHHGRPEPIWNIPLLQALAMFDTRDLKQLVVARIHTDALIFVHRGENPPTEEWAQRVADLAAEKFDDVFAAKLKELEAYYDSPEWYRDIREAIERVKDNRLNTRYLPLHSHDSINMLCRIIGVSCSIAASK